VTDDNAQREAMRRPRHAQGIRGRIGVLSSVRTIGFAVVGASLIWLVLVHSLAAYLAETAPDLALAINSSQPAALIKLTESRVNPKEPETPRDPSDRSTPIEDTSRLAEFAIAPAEEANADEAEPVGTDQARTAEAGTSLKDDPAAREQVRALAERALMLDPLNARALRLLAQIAEFDGTSDKVADLMKAAARRSLRETTAIHFMMQRRFELGDYIGTLDHADTILRTAPRLVRFVVPFLARIAEDAEARPLFEQRLAANPPWRAAVLSALPGAISDAHTLLDLLLSLRETPAPPTAADLRGYIGVLIKHGYFELAYYAWLQFLPPEQLASAGLLFNGHFEHAPSGLPFDWQIASGAGSAIYVGPAAGLDKGQALQIELGQGRVDFGYVQQTVLLAPGSYRFEGRYRGDLAGRRGLVWRLGCAGKQGSLLAQSPMIIGPAPTWRPFDVNFTVPETDCRAQQIRLIHDARSASEKFISGVVRLADLRIVRD